MKKLHALVLLLLWSSAANAAVLVGGQDRGGYIKDYKAKYEQLRDSGEQVVIDRECLSSCTLVLGFIPAERICVTATAVLGFHAAWKRTPLGSLEPSPEGTAEVMRIYPQPIREWLWKNGGLNSRMKYLQGAELTSLYPLCD
jgi:hypothetical protein